MPVDANGVDIRIGDKIRRITVAAFKDCQQWGMPEGEAAKNKYLGGDSLGTVRKLFTRGVETERQVFLGGLVVVEPK